LREARSLCGKEKNYRRRATALGQESDALRREKLTKNVLLRLGPAPHHNDDLSVVVFTVLQLVGVDLVGDLKMQNLTPFSHFK